jgi:hypothetical protein
VNPPEPLLQGKAEALFKQALEIQHRTRAPEHPWTIQTLARMAGATL